MASRGSAIVLAARSSNSNRARRGAAIQRHSPDIRGHAAGRRPAARHAREGSARGRAALSDQRRRQRSADLRRRRRRPQGRARRRRSTDRRRASRSTSVNDIPAGTYSVQALIHKYETFKRGDGHTVKMPMDRGEGQQWARAPGNVYSTPQTITIDPRKGGTVDDRARPDDSAAAEAEATRSTSGTTRFSASACRASGDGRCISARTCCCPRAGTRIPTRSIRCSSITATSPPISPTGARRRRIRISRPTSRRDSTGRATTARSRNTRRSSIATGPGRTSRARSSSRSSTPIRSTTTATP